VHEPSALGKRGRTASAFFEKPGRKKGNVAGHSGGGLPITQGTIPSLKGEKKKIKRGGRKPGVLRIKDDLPKRKRIQRELPVEGRRAP